MSSSSSSSSISSKFSRFLLSLSLNSLLLFNTISPTSATLNDHFILSAGPGVGRTGSSVSLTLAFERLGLKVYHMTDGLSQFSHLPSIHLDLWTEYASAIFGAIHFNTSATQGISPMAYNNDVMNGPLNPGAAMHEASRLVHLYDNLGGPTVHGIPGTNEYDVDDSHASYNEIMRVKNATKNIVDLISGNSIVIKNHIGYNELGNSTVFTPPEPIAGEGYDAGTDMPLCFLYREYHRRYGKNLKIILPKQTDEISTDAKHTRIPPGLSWAKSVRSGHAGVNMQTLVKSPYKYWESYQKSYLINRWMWGNVGIPEWVWGYPPLDYIHGSGYAYTDKFSLSLAAGHDAWLEQVKLHIPSNQILELELEHPDSNPIAVEENWKKLCMFLSDLNNEKINNICNNEILPNNVPWPHEMEGHFSKNLYYVQTQLPKVWPYIPGILLAGVFIALHHWYADKYLSNRDSIHRPSAAEKAYLL